MDTFQLSLAVLMLYRTWRVFRIRSRWDPYSGWKFDQPYSGYLESTFWPSFTGLSPFVVLLSSRLLVNQLSSAQVRTPHGYRISAKLWFVLCCFQSPLLTASRLLSLPGGNKMFQFSPFAITAYAVIKIGCPIRQRVVQYLHAIRHTISQLARTFVAFQAKPSTK